MPYFNNTKINIKATKRMAVLIQALKYIGIPPNWEIISVMEKQKKRYNSNKYTHN